MAIRSRLPKTLDPSRTEGLVTSKPLARPGGTQGEQGVQGVQGVQGEQGIQGFTGPVGEGSGGLFFLTALALTLATVAVDIQAVRTAGNLTVGDRGHALYRKKAVIEANELAGGKTSADGARWALVPEGGRVRVEQFGECGNSPGGVGGTDALGPTLAALDFIGIVINTERNFARTVEFGVAEYRFSSTLHMHRTGKIDGQSSGLSVGGSGGSTKWWFPVDTTYLVFHADVTGPGEDDNNFGPTLGNSGGSWVNGITFNCNGTQTSRVKRGILMRATATISNCQVFAAPGTGILIRAQAGAVDNRLGDANNWKVEDVYIHEARMHFLEVTGADTNGGKCNGLITHSAASKDIGCGVFEHDSIGANHYSGLQITGYGNCGVSYGGNRYQWNGPAEGPASTVPGSVDSERIWYFISTGGVDVNRFPDWATLDYANYKPKLPILCDSFSGFYAPYVETGACVSHISGFAFLVGGNAGTTIYSNRFGGSPTSGGMVGGGQTVLQSPNPIQSYREYSVGSPGHAANGLFAYSAIGSDSNGFNVLHHGKHNVDGGQSWRYGYRSDGNLTYRYEFEKSVYSVTTSATTTNFGRASPVPYMFMAFGLGLSSINNLTQRLFQLADDPISVPSGTGRGEWIFCLLPHTYGAAAFCTIDSNVWGTVPVFGLSSVNPQRNGDLVVECTSNTQLKFKYKGSDGVVRTASLTLA